MTWLRFAVGLWCCSCGYSEAEMQAQRDRTTQITDALDRVMEDHAICAERAHALETEIEALRKELTASGAQP